MLVDHKIQNIVIGCKDPNPEVSGNGIKRLKEVGSHVITGVLEGQCRDHHKRFLTYQIKKRPYIILKWAETEDGFIAPLQKDSQRPIWISNSHSRQLVHKWRAEEQAILVGYNTVLEVELSMNGFGIVTKDGYVRNCDKGRVCEKLIAMIMLRGISSK